MVRGSIREKNQQVYLKQARSTSGILKCNIDVTCSEKGKILAFCDRLEDRFVFRV